MIVIGRTIFISRTLEPNSVFRSELEAAGFQIEAWSYLTFEAFPFEYDGLADWLFFYSPRGVHYFFKQVNPAQIVAKIAVMGSGTARQLESFGITADFIGNGGPKKVLSQFLKRINIGETIYFAQATDSRNSIGKHLPEGIKKKILQVYKNKINDQQPLPKATTLIFTSPLNFKAYLEKAQHLNSKLRYIAIGPTTKKYMETELGQSVLTPELPSELSLAQLVLNDLA